MIDYLKSMLRWALACVWRGSCQIKINQREKLSGCTTAMAALTRFAAQIIGKHPPADNVKSSVRCGGNAVPDKLCTAKNWLVKASFSAYGFFIFWKLME